MAFNQSTLRNVRASGASVLAMVEGLGPHRDTGVAILREYGIGIPEIGKWYPIQAVLLAYREIGIALGTPVLFTIGEKLFSTIKFSDDVDSVEDALAAIDQEYYTHHAIDGKPLCEDGAGEQQEYIGHYRFVKTGPHSARMICDGPYPTYFDEGIIYSVTQRFTKDASVRLDEVKSTRQEGGKCDEFIIQWF